MLNEFRNEPFTDFTQEANAQAMRDALAQVRSELGREYPLVIGGERIFTDDKVISYNPACKTEVVGVHQHADVALANRAVETAARAFADWRWTPAAERAGLLFKAAALMRQRKHYYSAWMVQEVAKTWPEADGDTAEAIDFLEFYGREMLRYAAPQPVTRVDGENNEFFYVPLGVGAIIPPWNFPLAIMAGITVAAVVTGNTAVLKPSADAPTIAYKFFELLEECGLPAGVVNFLVGHGTEAGEAMVMHPQTRFISFTGSKAVGLHINEYAAKTQPGQRWIKRVVAEMGGKDAIIVNHDAPDLDAAATGIVQAAFGFQGQKCSACSRAIIHQDVYDEVLEKVVAKAKQLKTGDPNDVEVQMSAVINEKAFAKINGYIATGLSEGGRLMLGGKGDDSTGYFVEPTIIADVEPGATIEQEEIFGPVLGVIKARDFDHALAIANDTEFGLTGAAYTADEANLERARNEFHVGNLYLNRKCTGALVGVHPFGGFNMSGTDSKAGGRDYLLLFLQGKVTARKV